MNYKKLDVANETFKDDLKTLGTLIEALTHSGSNMLDEDLFSKVKKICKSSQTFIPKVYDLLLRQLKKKNSQIRYIAFLICKELFSRSALFREHLLTDLELIYKLTAEIDSKNKLPPPKASAKMLISLSIMTLKEWVNTFGATYKKLKIAYNYFKNCKKINFESTEIRSVSEQTRELEIQNRQRIMNEHKMKKLFDDIESNESEIKSTVKSLFTCLDLLLPPLEDFFIADTSNDEDQSSSTAVEATRHSSEEEHEDVNPKDLRIFGLTSDYKLSLEVYPNDKIIIEKNEENSSIIENARDCVRLITNKFLPMVKKWCQISCKYSDNNCQEIKKIIDMKQKIEKVLNKYHLLTIIGDKQTKPQYNDDSSDSDFEEVKKEGYEESIEFTEEDLNEINFCKQSLKTKASESKYMNNRAIENSTLDSKDCEANSFSEVKGENIMKDRKSKLLSIAPKLPFDIDLYHWEDEVLTTPTLISTKIDVDKFWGCASSDDIHEIPNPEGVAALRTRVIEFTGKFDPVKWTCRAPLPSGKLCPRRDRYKCPFHGKIIPRDENGQPETPEEKKEQKSASKSIPEWQDPELLNDIKQSTGIDLKMPERKGKKRKIETDNLTHKKMKTSPAALKIARDKNFPGLADVVRKKNNAYNRLSKKIFNRSSLKKVATVLNNLDKRKYQDKFGDCFNYL